MQSTQRALSSKATSAGGAAPRDVWVLSIVAHADPGALGRRLALSPGEEVVVGRGARELGRGVLEDPRISRRHARLWVDEHDVLWASDEHSRNGLRVNGLTVSRSRLSSDDVLCLGRAVSLFAHREPAFFSPRSHPTLAGVSHVHSAFVTQVTEMGEHRRPVLLEGESGSGLSSACRVVHEQGAGGGPLLEYSCGVVPEDKAYEMLHGDRQQPGLLSRAEHGTLVFSDVAAATATEQRILHRLLTDPRVRPLGNGCEEAITARLIFQRRIEAGSEPAALAWCPGSREDRLRIPALRERPVDIAVIAAHLLGPDQTLDDASTRALLSHPFPGNVVELARALEAGCAVAIDSSVQRVEVQLGQASAPAPAPATGCGPDLVLGREGQWFQWEGQSSVDLRQRVVLSRLLHALATAHERKPGQLVSVAELIQRVWPDERLLKRPAKNRLYVAVSTLRKLGLGESLERGPTGYRLNSEVRLSRSAEACGR